MIPTFIVNLPKSKERRESALAACSEIGISPEIVNAFDGRTLQNDQRFLEQYKDKLIFSEKVELNLPYGIKATMLERMSPSEYGCALSHLHIYKLILSRGISEALIMEDDIAPQYGFCDFIQGIISKKQLWDIVQISSGSGIRRFFGEKRYKIDCDGDVYLKKEGMGILDPIFNRRRLSFRTSCYLINSHACERLVQIGFPIRIPADYLLGFPAYNRLRLFTVDPSGAFLKEDLFDSDITLRPRHKLI